MKYLVRAIVVGVILLVFGVVYSFFTAVERRADMLDRALAIQRVTREVFSTHLCRMSFLSSCRGVPQDGCAKEMVGVMEKCADTEFKSQSSLPELEQGRAALRCALTQYLEAHPDIISEERTCEAPPEIDHKALNDDIEAAISKLADPKH